MRSPRSARRYTASSLQMTCPSCSAPREGDVDLGLDLDGLQRTPLGRLEGRRELRERLLLFDRHLGLGGIIVEFPQRVIERAALPGASGALLDPRMEEGSAQRLAVRTLGQRAGDRPHRRTVVAHEVLEARGSDARGRLGDVAPTATLRLGEEGTQDRRRALGSPRPPIRPRRRRARRPARRSPSGSSGQVRMRPPFSR